VTGSVVRRGESRYALIIERGYVPDPKQPGRLKRKQQWIAFRGSKRDAQAKLRELLKAQDDGAFVEPSKRTVGQWFDEWIEKAIVPSCALGTIDVYRSAINNHVRPAIGGLRLQALGPVDLEQFYAQLVAKKQAPRSIGKIHTIVNSALKAALRSGYVARNVASLVNTKPNGSQDAAKDAREHCWEAADARAFLKAAKDAGTQPAAFYGFALDTGARKSEICGLRWEDVDMELGRVTVHQQLSRHGRKNEDGRPILVPTKTKRARVVTLAADTVELLRVHRQAQNELKMRNRQHYRDHGLVFAKGWNDLTNRRHALGEALQANNLGQREYARLIKAAGVKPIKFHGLRHTSATLMLSAGVEVHVVAKRLGHKKVTTTLEIYAHALPSQQTDAAERLGALLHG
jgi:integrase